MRSTKPRRAQQDAALGRPRGVEVDGRGIDGVRCARQRRQRCLLPPTRRCVSGSRGAVEQCQSDGEAGGCIFRESLAARGPASSQRQDAKAQEQVMQQVIQYPRPWLVTVQRNACLSCAPIPALS